MTTFVLLALAVLVAAALLARYRRHSEPPTVTAYREPVQTPRDLAETGPERAGEQDIPPNFVEWLRRACWPKIPDQKAARAVARYGAWAAFIGAGRTVLMILVNLAPPIAYADAALNAVLGLLILRMSRFGAVAALALFVLERVYAGLAYGVRGVAWPAAIVLLLAFVHSVRATFAFHRYKDQDEAQAAGRAAPII